jgi:hypothetical protein
VENAIINRPSSLACKSPPSDTECGGGEERRGERRRRRICEIEEMEMVVRETRRECVLSLKGN